MAQLLSKSSSSNTKKNFEKRQNLEVVKKQNIQLKEINQLSIL